MLEHTSALSNLGVTHNHLFVFLIGEKLDTEKPKKRELQKPVHSSIADPQTLSDMLVIQTAVVRALEASPTKRCQEVTQKVSSMPQASEETSPAFPQESIAGEDAGMLPQGC